VCERVRGVHSRPGMARIRLPLIDRLRRWPVVRQVATGDATGLGDTARSARTDAPAEGAAPAEASAPAESASSNQSGEA